MVVKRGDNTGEGSGKRGIVDMSVEMECYEKLGPRMRAQIDNAPVKILAAPIVFDVEKAGKERGIEYDFNDPKIDASLAAGVQKQILNLLRLDRDEVDALAGVISLKPRPGSARKGRRAYR